MEVLVSVTVDPVPRVRLLPVLLTWYPGWAGFAGYDATWGVYYPWVPPARCYATVIDAGSLRMEMLDVRTAELFHQAADRDLDRLA